ncbi:MAG: hypothetical protein J6K12_01210, partial [Clostridia bacterium]|nr:hypothetical protein [Clostridia bacterium]
MNKNSKSKANPILVILVVTLVLLAICGVILYAAGFRYISDDNVKFIGKVRDGVPYSGSITYKNGTKGKLVTDKETGNARIEYSTGDVYTGDLDGVVRHGKGTITYVTGAKYEGDFVNNERTGAAVIQYASGDIY